MDFAKLIVDLGALGILVYVIWLNQQMQQSFFAILRELTGLIQSVRDELKGLREDVKCLSEKKSKSNSEKSEQ